MAARQAKYWRDAATLILASKTTNRTPAQLLVTSTQGQLERSTFTYDYNVLMLRRSASSSFMPSAYVFPGGVVEKSDFSDEWCKLYQEFAGESMSDLVTQFHVSGERPPIIRDYVSHSLIPPDIGFRICAIRETFEESGLLLVRHLSTNSAMRTDLQRSHEDLEIWRNKVDNDSSSFIDLCRKLQVVPNIWALTEWCNWLTPTREKMTAPPVKPHRFDTIFYLCCLDASQLTNASADEKETHEAEWMSPGQFISAGGFDDNRKRIKLMGPQLYELGRLARFHTQKELKSYSDSRSKLGTERWMSVHVVLKDGYLSLLPGDEMFPHTPDYEGTSGEWPLFLDQTCAEINGSNTKQHRSTRLHTDTNARTYTVVCTTKLACGQVPPLEFHKLPNNL